MEHKIDKNFKSELDQRTMNPNPAAWDRLDAMLSMEEKKKPFLFRNWMAVAAGFIGIMIVVLISIPFFYNKNETIITNKNDQKNPIRLENNPTTNENMKPTIESTQLPNNQSITTKITQQIRPKTNGKKVEQEFINKVELPTEQKLEAVTTIVEANEKVEKNEVGKTIEENKKVEIASIENEKNKTEIPDFRPKIKLKKIKVDPNLLLTNADEEKKSILQRVLVVANSTGSTFYQKVATRNIEVH